MNNDALAVEVVLQHIPDVELDYGCCELDGVALTWRCKAEGCNWMPPFGDTMPSWEQHVANAINDHLGLWGPDDEND